MNKKERSEAMTILYIIFIILTFPIWILFYVMKFTK